MTPYRFVSKVFLFLWFISLALYIFSSVILMTTKLEDEKSTIRENRSYFRDVLIYGVWSLPVSIFTFLIVHAVAAWLK